MQTKYSFMLAFTWLLFIIIISCQKPALSPKHRSPKTPPTEDTSSSSSGNSSGDTVIPYTISGALITGSDTLTTDFEISVLEKLNTNFTRCSMVMTNWDGKWNEFSRFDESGYKVFANICYGRATVRNPSPYPKDTISYKKTLNDVLDNFSPVMVIIENEETDVTKHTGSMQEYINELTAAIGVVHSHELKGTNGGLSTRPITYLVYRYYYNKGQIAKANDFAQRCIPDRFIYNISHPGSNPVLEDKLKQWDSLITAYRNIPIDYVNVHIYEPVKYRGEINAAALSENITKATPGALREICDYLTETTGKKVICTEMGQLNMQPDLVTSMLDTCNVVKLKYTIWYSGDAKGDGAVALHNPDGKLRENGIAFRDYPVK